MTVRESDSDGGIDFFPVNASLPFFAYGVFKPGELAFLQLKELVTKCSDCTIRAALRIRDGLPIAALNSQNTLPGTLIEFQTGLAEEAYRRIAKLEPKTQYRWDIADTRFGRANALLGRSPMKGSISADGGVWNGAEDPLFTAALEVIEEVLRQNQRFEWDLKPLFRLEMAYLLLWTAIERYASLRYHLAERATEKVIKIAEEEAFMNAVKDEVTEQREIYRADDPCEKFVLDSNNPKKAIKYYYQIRHNLVHRGKGVPHDHERLAQSLRELLAIFRAVLNAAFREAQWRPSIQG